MTAATEQHYSPKEVAKIWRVSEATIRRLFEDQPGVLRISLPRIVGSERKHRPHVRLSIPSSVLGRVHEQWTASLRSEVQRRRRAV